jgi:hypothetical protein
MLNRNRATEVRAAAGNNKAHTSRRAGEEAVEVGGLEKNEERFAAALAACRKPRPYGSD